MSNLFGGGGGTVAAPAPVTPPPPPPTLQLPEGNSAANEIRRKAAANIGANGTIMTSPLGDTTSANTTRKKLFGG